jgi:hypothetical protein
MCHHEALSSCARFGFTLPNGKELCVDDSSISRVVEILQPFAKPTVLLDYSLEVR